MKPLLIVDLVIWLILTYILGRVLESQAGIESGWVAATIMICTTFYAKFEQFRIRRGG